MMQYFHFTLGPVQGFVSQARRTRDFWAGSFLLSWLSAIAMRTVQKQNGEILFPEPDKEFMDALETGSTSPKQGNIPNRFKAIVPDGFLPDEVQATVQYAWSSLANLVYRNDIAPINPDPETEEIWNRQIAQFWEISWVLTNDPGDSSVIDRLKNWRTHLPPDEQGVKCMMMEGWQELSGTPSPNQKQLNEFWSRVRNNPQSGMQTDLREHEYLCAIAFVKRRFSRYFKGFDTTTPRGWPLKGWKLPNGVPSVHYMAAAPWLAELIEKANADPSLSQKMWDFHDAAHSLTGSYGEWESNIRCVRKAINANSGQRKWAALDGSVLFDAILENPNLWDSNQQAQAGRVMQQLKAVRKAARLDPVSPFYAVLLMDGDQLGIHMSDSSKQIDITTGLARFTEKVGDIVEKHSGFLIYAGGDDVLALLPLEDALSCAADLRAHYLNCFSKSDIRTSLSGAVEYAHIKMPLSKVLRDAHDLLDNVAKEGQGRDAIACRVWKPGGLAVEWAMPWECALDDGTSVILNRLAEEFRSNSQSGNESDRFASKFFYKILERFELLNPENCGYCHETDYVRLAGNRKPLLGPDQAISLMAAEYISSGSARTKSLDEARKIIRPLLEQCRPVIRDASKSRDEWMKSTCLKADGALLIRFLAHKGVER